MDEPVPSPPRSPPPVTSPPVTPERGPSRFQPGSGLPRPDTGDSERSNGSSTRHRSARQSYPSVTPERGRPRFEPGSRFQPGSGQLASGASGHSGSSSTRHRSARQSYPPSADSGASKRSSALTNRHRSGRSSYPSSPTDSTITNQLNSIEGRLLVIEEKLDLLVSRLFPINQRANGGNSLALSF